jgi:hypothetical protein
MIEEEEEEEESFLEKERLFWCLEWGEVVVWKFLGHSWKRVGIAGIVFESGAMVHPGQDPDSKLK